MQYSLEKRDKMKTFLHMTVHRANSDDKSIIFKVQRSVKMSVCTTCNSACASQTVVQKITAGRQFG